MAKKTLADFLLDNPVNEITEEIIVSERLKDYKFKIRAMTSDDFNGYQNRFAQIGRHNKINFDNGKYNMTVIINHTMEPNFKDATMLEKAGCTTPEEFINKFLLAGEIAELSSKITALSGFDDSFEDLVDDAKN